MGAVAAGSSRLTSWWAATAARWGRVHMPQSDGNCVNVLAQTRTETAPMVHPQTDHARMQRRVNEVAQPKNIADAVNRSADQVRKWARDPDDHDADSTGCRGPLSMVRSMFRELVLHGAEGRACAVELREWICREADEAMGVAPEPSTLQFRLSAVADTLRETGEAAAAAARGEVDSAEVSREIAEAIASLEKLQRIVATPTPVRDGLRVERFG